MKCDEIIQIIEQNYPPDAACGWDNVGLLAGRAEKEVRKIYLALDATDEVIQRAKEAEADMLVTHHPLIFSPLKRVTDEHFIGRRIVTLIQDDISYYAMHTNYDVVRMGFLAAEKMHFQNPCAMEEGIGVSGMLEKAMTLAECCGMVKAAFRLPSVRLFGDPGSLVKCAATVPGSGKGQVPAALKSGAQVFITGDIDHHEGMDALAQGLFIIDAGHYGLEHIFMEDMRTFLNQACPGVIAETAPVCFPFQVI